MDEKEINELLKSVKEGTVSVEKAAEKIKYLQFERLRQFQ